MKTAELGKTGEVISRIGLGCMLMGSTIGKTESFSILDYYLEKGGNFLDTANCYAWWIGKGEFIGNESEELLGQWFKERGNREKVFLATKVGARLRDPHNIRDKDGNPLWDKVRGEYEYLSPAVIRKGVEDSLKRLGTDYIDLYYAHIDDRNTPIEVIMETFNRLKEEGKIKHIGCSNFRTWRLERAQSVGRYNNRTSFCAIQQQCSYLRPKAGADFGVGVNIDQELTDYLKSNDDVSLVGYSPLLKGIYDDKAKREACYIWPLFNTEDNRIRLETLSKMAAELGVGNNQLVLAWLLHLEPAVFPLVGVSRFAQIEPNLRAADISLSGEQMAILNNA
ncbi:MAG: aldo/keto reductase [Spirochaetia bacterium]